MENYEMFDDRAFFLFFNLNKLWICKKHHSFVDVLEIHIGLQKRWIHDLDKQYASIATHPFMEDQKREKACWLMSSQITKVLIIDGCMPNSQAYLSR